MVIRSAMKDRVISDVYTRRGAKGDKESKFFNSLEGDHQTGILTAFMVQEII
jgi:hypothetical protein